MSMPRISLVLLAFLTLLPLAASAWERGTVQRFASLPPGSPNPEGIAADRHGDIYVSGFSPTSPAGPGKVFVFDGSRGHLKRVLQVAGSSNALLGLGFTAHDELLVIDFGASQVLRVNKQTGASTVFMTVPPPPAGGAHGLNALTFDGRGNVYVSDSFQGVIWKTGPRGGLATAWKSDPLLTASGFPPFGANGLQFNSDESALFVANTGNDSVVRIESIAGNAGAASVFTNSINGADGLMLDADDNVWVCANQSDEIVVTDPSGKAIAKVGDFGGVVDGSPVGFLFPASLVRVGDWIYVTNLSLDLRPITGQQSVDSQWAAQVTTHTISRVPARIPR
jgi:sugar lactone lactonase YvrE